MPGGQPGGAWAPLDLFDSYITNVGKPVLFL